jgi:meso-butanediol dehydrogenase/(S,S)-butanediol dehydrogenase/diacetyl reductase
MPLEHSGAMSGRVAVVTGAARGLGFHFAQALVEAGARVAMLARSEDLLREAARGLGTRALAIPTDIASPAAVKQAFAQAEAAFGGVDILVNNAMLTFIHRIEDATDEELGQQVGVNILGTIYCMREAIPAMRRRGGGDIVNISTESVTRPFPMLTAYAATKAAIENLTIGMREEVRGDNIRMTTLRSGTVASGGNVFQGADPAKIEAFMAAAGAGGYLHDVGKAISPQTTAQALLALLAMPRDAHIDFVAVRAS